MRDKDNTPSPKPNRIPTDPPAGEQPFPAPDNSNENAEQDQDQDQDQDEDHRQLGRQLERQQELQQRRYNAVWSERTFDDLPDWAHRELERTCCDV